MKYIIASVFILAWGLPWQAVAQPADVIGWHDIPWGSTHATWQTKLDAPLEKRDQRVVERYPPTVTQWHIPTYLIADHAFEVNFHEDQTTGELIRVKLRLETKGSEETLRTIFDAVKATLEHQYGPRPMWGWEESYGVAWEFPTTTILLHAGKGPRRGKILVTLSFEPREPVKKDSP